MNVIGLFVVGALVGGFLEFFIGELYSHLATGHCLRVHHRFSWRNYIGFVSLLLWGLLGVIYGVGFRTAGFIMAAAIVGFICEFVLGKIWELIFGHKLWTYHRLPIGEGYTSWLTLPLWAVAGVVFLGIAQLFWF